jgi:cytochrome c oxidase subunit 2
MKVDLYEKIWMWGVAVMLAVFFASTAAAAFGGAVHPPSHIETIDPAKVMSDPRLKPLGVTATPDGHLHARIIGMTFAWLPAAMTLPAETPVTFHISAADVVHGFEIVRTNGQSMVIPGYISQFTTQFKEPGEYLIVCNEYCGIGHHMMAAKLTVVSKSAWSAPATASAPAMPAGGDHAGH